MKYLTAWSWIHDWFSALLLLYVSKAFEELLGIFPIFIFFIFFYCSPQYTVSENDQQEIQEVKTECVLRCHWGSVRSFVNEPHSDTQCLNFCIFSLIPWKHKHIIANKKKYIVLLNEGGKKSKEFHFPSQLNSKLFSLCHTVSIKYFSSQKLKD